MELAIQHAIRKRPMEVVVLGGTGSRLDHTIATLQLLDLLLTAKIPHVLMNETNKIRLIGRGKTVIEKASYRYLSILPYTKNIIFSLNGFRYDLVRKTLQQGITRGVSNEIQKAQGVIRIFSGKAWVVESND
jgi:thiamine pyrophosphokinase